MQKRRSHLERAAEVYGAADDGVAGLLEHGGRLAREHALVRVGAPARHHAVRRHARPGQHLLRSSMQLSRRGKMYTSGKVSASGLAGKAHVPKCFYSHSQPPECSPLSCHMRSSCAAPCRMKTAGSMRTGRSW